MVKERGAHYEKNGAFEPPQIEDGLLITIINYYSRKDFTMKKVPYYN